MTHSVVSTSTRIAAACLWALISAWLAGIGAAMITPAPLHAQEQPALQAYDNYDLAGQELRSLPVADLPACQAACQSEAACQAFTFEKWSRRCVLRASPNASRFDPGIIAGLRSGLSFPALAATPMAMQRRLQIAFQGDGVTEPSATSMEACEAACKRNQDCVAVTFNQACTVFRSLSGRSANAAASSSEKRQQTEADTAAEAEFWHAVEESSRKEDLQAYLDVFPAGNFAQAALAKIKAMASPAAPASAGGAELHDKFTPPWVISLDHPIETWDQPSPSAKRVATISRDFQFSILGTVGDGSWYRIARGELSSFDPKPEFVPRSVIEAGKPLSAGADDYTRLQQAVTLLDNDASQREAALKSIRYGAVGQAGTQFWFRWNGDDAAAVNKLLVDGCSASNCKLVASFRSPFCFALYRKKPNGFAWAVRKDIGTAIHDAEASCVQANKSCVKSASFCADGSNVFSH